MKASSQMPLTRHNVLSRPRLLLGLCPRVIRWAISSMTVGLLAAAFSANATQVTYQVNLGVQIALGNFRPGTDTIFVSGNFSNPNWISTSAASAYRLFPSAGDTNIYVGTFSVVNSPGSTENHKFVINPNNNYNNLNWENVTGGGNRFFQVGSGIMTLPVVYFDDQSLGQPPFPFIAGADFSLLSFFENGGILYKDGGQAQDGLAILKNHGINCIRLRLFTSSAAQAAADPYNYTNNLTYTVPLAVRVKNAGLQFLLDFHYSDTWADPGHQAKPAAWAGQTTSQLTQQIRNYTSNSISTFIAAGAAPDFVQIGNEITHGILWTNSSIVITNNWPVFAQMLNASAQGIHDAAGNQMPKVIVHIDRGGDWGNTEYFFDTLNSLNVPYDIIGESYYPWWHGPTSNLANCLTNAAKRYDKPVLVAETAFPWTNTYWNTNIYGFTPSPTGQVQFLVALAQIVKNVPSRMGCGLVYWGAEYRAATNASEAGFNTASFFDAGGNLLGSCDAVGQMAAPLVLTASLNHAAFNLTWPLSGAASSLLTATNLGSPAYWSLVTNSVQNTGIVFGLTLPLDASLSRFYRLQSP